MQPINYDAPRALVVDDDPDVVEFVTAVLGSAGWEVQYAATGDEALYQAERFGPDLIFLDVNIPEQSGWLVCAKLKLVSRVPAIVLMTGRTDRKVLQQAAFVGADGLLHKPFSAKEILRIVQKVSFPKNPLPTLQSR